jgi:lipopolysaccharide/colanic/teichoic acid biosynthesis glycosyltransferase
MTVDDIYVKKILPEKMSYNLEYLKKCSIIEDIKLCVKTVI